MKKLSVKKIRKVLCCVLTLVIVLGNSSAVYADTSTYTRALSGSKDATTVSGAKVYIGAQSDITMHTNFIIIGQWVRSDGVSKLTTKSVTGYYYSLVEDGHTIKATVQGVSADINFNAGSKISSSSKELTYACDTAVWSYQIDVDGSSLTGYKETHTGKYKIFQNGASSARETISVSATMSVY